MADQETTPQTPPVAEPSPQAQPAPVVDVQAEVQKALSEQQKQFKEQLKEATGHDSVQALRDAQLAEQGKTQELLESRSQELAEIKSRFQNTQIQNALLNAAGDAVDPAVVASLLAGQCQCDEQGNVTVNGKAVGEAVKSLLDDKPFLAKPSGNIGSGAPQQSDGKTTLGRAAFDALDVLGKSKFIRDGGIVTD